MFGMWVLICTCVFVLTEPRLEQVYDDCVFPRQKDLAAWKEPPCSPQAPSPGWKESHDTLTWLLQGALAAGHNICSLRSSSRRSGVCRGRKGKPIEKKVDFRAYLWFILDVETPGLPIWPVECVPPGGSRDSVMARDGLWINRVLSGRKEGNLNGRTKSEPPWDLGRPVPREQEEGGSSWVQGYGKRTAGTKQS